MISAAGIPVPPFFGMAAAPSCSSAPTIEMSAKAMTPLFGNAAS